MPQLVVQERTALITYIDVCITYMFTHSILNSVTWDTHEKFVLYGIAIKVQRSKIYFQTIFFFEGNNSVL